MSIFERLYVNASKIDLSVYTLDQSAYPSTRSKISTFLNWQKVLSCMALACIVISPAFLHTSHSELPFDLTCRDLS